MFDIRDHGGIYGAGKYRKGSKLFVSDTIEKKPLIMLSRVYKQSTLLRDCLGEDNTNYYYSFYGSNYQLFILNKLTDKDTYSVYGFTTPIMHVASINDGYVYILTDTTLRKINVNTGEQVWSVYLDYSSISTDAVKIYVDGTHVYVFFHNSGTTTSVAKVTVGGVKVSNITIPITSKYYYLEGTTLYSIAMNEVTLYKHDITTGNLISQTAIQAPSSSVMAVDYKNGAVGITYSYTQPNIIAKRFDGGQLWAYNISTAQPNRIVAMKDGIYVSEYSGRDVKLGLDGKVLYSNYQPYPTAFERIYHDYGKEYLLGNTYAYSGSYGYNTPTKIQEYLTIQ